MDRLMAHVMNLTGIGGTLDRKDFKRCLRPGSLVTLIQWDGCMAHIRNVVGQGTLLRHESRILYGSSETFDGILVRYETGERWEPLDYVRINDGAIEVWR